MRRKGGGGAGTHFSWNDPENHLMLVNMTLVCNQLFFRNEKVDPEQEARTD